LATSEIPQIPDRISASPNARSHFEQGTMFGFALKVSRVLLVGWFEY
jgi:hypothetical protein